MLELIGYNNFRFFQFFHLYTAIYRYQYQLTKSQMNIRKKILFNPSHLKSTKPDTSDTTTAHTKNSAILEQSKTFRFSNQKTISTRRQRNYLRTLSKDPKESDLTYNHAASIKKRNIIIPSLSTMSNQNFMPIKKSALGRKFLLQQDQLPPLVSLKRTDLLTSQQQRKQFNYPSSVHVSSNKQILARQQPKKQPTPQQQQPKASKPQPQMMILGQNYQQIQRRKQKLNSLNVASFYTTQKSIALSKYSIRSRETNRLEGKGSEGDKKEVDCGVVQKDQRMSRFVAMGEEGKVKVDEVKQSPQKGFEKRQEEEMDESIVEEIEKNQSVLKEQPKENKLRQQNTSSNEWSQTLKSSYSDSNKKNQHKMTKKGAQNKTNENASNNESSLCESQVINSQQVQEKKNTYRNTNKSIEVESTSKQKQKSFGQQKQNPKQSKQQVDSEESSLCESYQVETPQKRSE